MECYSYRIFCNLQSSVILTKGYQIIRINIVCNTPQHYSKYCLLHAYWLELKMFILAGSYSAVMACAGSARWRRFRSCHQREKMAKDGSSFVLSGIEKHRKYFASALWKDPLSIWFVHGWGNSWHYGNTEDIIGVLMYRNTAQTHFDCHFQVNLG